MSGWPIAENLARIHERIAGACARAGRRPEEVTLLAVSKTFPAEAIRAAYTLGIRHFGENRVQEFEAKRAALTGLSDAVWHLIGHLQGNKARRALQLFHRVDSVDSIALAQRLARAAEEHRKPAEKLPVLIEVRLADEDTKSGVAPEELPALLESVRALPQLELRGLMCIPPMFDDAERARPYFRRLRELRDELRVRLSSNREPRASNLDVLSMGMSHDFAVAIEEGATEIRVGTALFGSRKAP